MSETELLTLADYRGAYASGRTTPAQQIAEVFARIARYDDPAMFVALRPLADVRTDAEALERRGPAGLPLFGVPFAVKDNIDVAGLPTTAACPAFAYMPEADASSWRGCAPPGRSPSARPTSTSSRPGSSACARPIGVPRNAVRRRARAGRLELGLGGGGGARLVPLRARHRHRGLGPGAGGAQQHRRAEADARRSFRRGRRAGLPDARLRLGLRADGRRRLDGLRARSPGSTRGDPYSRRVAGRDAPARRRRRRRSACRDASSRRFFGDARRAAPSRRRVAALAALGARIEAIDFAPFFEAGAAALRRALGGRALRGDRAPLVDATPRRCIPVTRGDHRAARRADGGRRLRAASTGSRRCGARVGAGAGARRPALRADLPAPATLAELAADPIGPNARLGTYTNFVNLLELCAPGRAGRRAADGRPGSVTLLAPAGARRAARGPRARARTRARGATLGATGWPLPAARSGGRGAEPARSNSPSSARICPACRSTAS